MCPHLPADCYSIVKVKCQWCRCSGCSLPPSPCLSPSPLLCLSLISHHLTPAIPLCPAAPRAEAVLWGTAALTLIRLLFPWILLTLSKLEVFFPCCDQRTWMRYQKLASNWAHSEMMALWFSVESCRDPVFILLKKNTTSDNSKGFEKCLSPTQLWCFCQ